MKVVTNTPEELELLIELPKFILWFMLGPIALFGGLFTLALLLGGEFLNALGTGLVIGAIVAVGGYFITQRTRLQLNARDGKVYLLRTSWLERRTHDFPLEHLDGAEVEQRQDRRDHDGGTNRPTSTVSLVFNNTRPATRVPLTLWAVSGGGSGMLANAINDWLRERAQDA
ncbi:hypothetical protein [Thioalkalivibrio sp. XN279]|uniref:hypothetical protein n=1 Tax=Thioalkalivibrio sp. XN279 TaxID=2714953 RepID=UPI00140B144F|nr:hypothetical protein [Thioalkalivibrio sp. XN279]NHA13944.1 hypothetical protein [Thioalkalivibrio sp. XN279]